MRNASFRIRFVFLHISGIWIQVFYQILNILTGFNLWIDFKKTSWTASKALKAVENL